MNDEFVNQIHGQIGNDGDGSALLIVSNFGKQHKFNYQIISILSTFISINFQISRKKCTGFLQLNYYFVVNLKMRCAMCRSYRVTVVGYYSIFY